MMWTLVIFTLFGNPSAGGGTYANVTTIQFPTQQLCLDAANTLAAKGALANGSPISYEIFGKCVRHSV